MEAISKKIQVDFDDQDLSYINRQLVGYGIKLETSTEQTYKKYEPIINKIIRNMSEIMHVDFSKDTALKEHFSQHFIPMIYRLKMGIETTNPLLAEIKSQYAIIFSSTWYAMGNVESELGVHFNDDEVAFLAMYFQVSLEKSQHGKKILIVCPTGVGTSELIGMEEKIFPLSRSLMEESELEEERRLAYVGITRAEESLYLTNAFSRTLYGKTQYNQPSRFVAEIDDSLLNSVGMQPQPKATFNNPFTSNPNAMKPKYQHATRQPMTNKTASGGENENWNPGDKVQHKKWGTGTVVKVSGNAKDVELDIAFPQQGVKRLLAAFAPIQKV